MNRHDPVTDRALGAVDRELRAAARDGQRLRLLRQQGLLTPQELDAVRSRYRGLCRSRLEAALKGEEPAERTAP